MKPITAVTLRILKVYSASPYVFTPLKLIVMMISKKMEMLAHAGIGRFQYSRVMDADMISKGITNIHCRA